MTHTPEDTIQTNALFSIHAALKSSNAVHYAFMAVREMDSKLWKTSAVREARALRDDLNKFLEEMKTVEIQLEAAE